MKKLKFYFIGSIITIGLSSIFYFSTMKNGQKVNTSSLPLKEMVKNNNWHQFVPDSKQFTLDFPSSQKPEYIFKELPVPKSENKLPYHEYLFNDKEIQYSISYTELPGNWLSFGSKLVLKGAIKVLVENQSGAKLIDSFAGGSAGYPTLDYKMTKDGNEVTGQLILVGNALYRLEVSYPPAAKDTMQENVGIFLESFKATSSKEPSPSQSPSQQQDSAFDKSQDQ